MDLFRLVKAGLVVLLVSSVNSTLVSSYDNELNEIKLFFYSPLRATEIDVDASDGSIPEFERARQLKVIIHGWNADRDQVATVPIRAAYLLQGAHNVLVADWANVSSQLYPVARQLVLPVGYRIGSILARFMERYGIAHDQVHLVGHSLGAHVAGSVGRYFGGRLARITGLDPAGPLFVQRSRDALATDTARFVDVIHTDGHVLGEVVVRGHVDFYPNRGLPPQPGCETLDVITLRMENNGCSHYRSTGFFAESIQLPNNFVACECGMEEIFDQYAACLPSSQGPPLRACIRMGEAVDSGARGTFFLLTSRVPPYGMGNRTAMEGSG
ncbi:AGAP005000-PA-like protein [Anopheles sinensis]|uniref:AGAP005000-PA-like protein n=1 Tax=Anopheles sinensis TaxID=74873 RepID=A0A084WDV5_ANOSI|nr:AGAP005000-PA-like protein [Anopheles sinensis]